MMAPIAKELPVTFWDKLGGLVTGSALVTRVEPPEADVGRDRHRALQLCGLTDESQQFRLRAERDGHLVHDAAWRADALVFNLRSAMQLLRLSFSSCTDPWSTIGLSLQMIHEHRQIQTRPSPSDRVAQAAILLV